MTAQTFTELSVRAATPADAAAYDVLHSAAADALVQHSWQWRDVIEATCSDTPVYLLAHDQQGELVGALPSVHVRGKHGDLLLSLPLAGAYGGVFSVATDEHQRADIRRILLQRFVEEARERECVLATVATSPFARDSHEYATDLEADFVRDNFVQYIELAAWHESAPASASVAKYIKRARAAQTKHGLHVRFCASPANTLSEAHFAGWNAMHEQRMRAIGASPLPATYLHAIHDCIVCSGNGTMVYVLHDEQLLAGCMFVGHGSVLDCFMLSGSDEGDRLLATSVLVVEALEWARNAGYQIFNWQSSSSRESGVYHFKQKWGSVEGAHQYVTRIVGDISALRCVPLPDVRAEYPWRYVMPFEQFTSQP